MIKQLNLVDFRGHTRQLNFGPNHNVLRGPNESGKSTVKEALAFLWYGTDSAGSKNPDHLITEGASAMQISGVTSKITLERKKRRGATSTIKLTREGFPAISMTQTELQAMLKLSLDSSLSCWNTGYFMRLGQTEQMLVLGELSAVDRRALLESLLPYAMTIPAKVKLLKPLTDAEAVAGERRGVQNMLASDEGSLTQIQGQLAAWEAQESIDTESYRGRLNEIEAELHAFDFYKQALAKYQTDKVRFDTAQSYKVKLLAELGEVSKVTEPPPADVHLLNGHLKAAEQEFKNIPELEALPTVPVKPKVQLEAGAQCGTCGQSIDEKHVNKIMGAYEESLIAYNKIAREVESHNDKVRVAHAALQTKISGYLNEIMSRENAFKSAQKIAAGAVASKHRIEDELGAIESLKAPIAPEKPAGNEDPLRKEQLDISTQLGVAAKQNSLADGLKTQAQMLMDQVQKRKVQVDELAVIEKALRSLPVIETQKLLEGLQIEGVKVELVEGKIVVCGDRNVPYPSLSSGRRMKVDLAFCASLRKAAGQRAPTWLFADDSDLMDTFVHLLPGGLQSFSAKVDGSLKELMVVQDA